MLHPHLAREYPRAIATIIEINSMLEAKGMPAVDCVTFRKVHEQSVKQKQYETQTETGYSHIAAKVAGMRLEWTLVYYSNKTKTTGLFVEVKSTFFDNPKNRDSQVIIARYHVAENTWWFRWTNLTPDGTQDISSDLASELLFVNGLDISEKDEWALETPDALKLINSMAALYQVQDPA